MTKPPHTDFGRRKPAAPTLAPSPPVKRSRHVALLVMGTLAVGGGAYALMPHENCQPASPGMAAPSTPGAAQGCTPRSSSGGGRGGSSGWSSHSSFYGGSSASSGSTPSSSGTTTTTRGGFGGFAGLFSGGS